MVVRPRLKVLSYNIHKGFALGNASFTLPEIKRAISSLELDVVFLQEVLGQHDWHASRVERWPDLPQSHFLAENVWPHVAYGKTSVFDHGHQGNAILSKYPILEFENIDISTNAIESRSLLHAVIDVPGLSVPVHCVCVHLNLMRRGREAQLKRICDRVTASVGGADPLIVAGDFNDWQQRASGVLARELRIKEVFLDTHGTHAATFPMKFPLFRLDRVYARGLSMVGGQALKGQPWDTLSDHIPLYAELEEEEV
jgi:endonuclease/exonuclease/phosphatase family metal-dependent hydrolase